MGSRYADTWIDALCRDLIKEIWRLQSASVSAAVNINSKEKIIAKWIFIIAMNRSFDAFRALIQSSLESNFSKAKNCNSVQHCISSSQVFYHSFVQSGVDP